MNRQITTLFRLAAIGIALLITITAYWQIWAASSLADRRDNARLVYKQLQIKRGLILASNGKTVLARNRPVQRTASRCTPAAIRSARSSPTPSGTTRSATAAPRSSWPRTTT